MVSLCAGCDRYEPWGGLAFLSLHHLLLFRLQLDDPLDAVAVHGGGGLVGLLAVPVFMQVGLEPGERGLLWAGALAISVWAAAIFGLLSLTNLRRVSRHDELRGMELNKHGEVAYADTVLSELRQGRQ